MHYQPTGNYALWDLRSTTGVKNLIEESSSIEQAYKLDLPPSYTIHDVFHVSLLEPTHQPKQQPTLDETHDTDWEVEEILDSRRSRRRL